MNHSVNLTPELAQLLKFISNIGVAIRVKRFEGSFNPKENHDVHDVFWLSDAIHHLDKLARAILGGSPDFVIEMCDSISDIFKWYEAQVEKPQGYLSAPASTFKRNKALVQLQEGLAIFDSIKAKCAT